MVFMKPCRQVRAALACAPPGARSARLLRPAKRARRAPTRRGRDRAATNGASSLDGHLHVGGPCAVCIVHGQRHGVPPGPTEAMRDAAALGRVVIAETPRVRRVAMHTAGAGVEHDGVVRTRVLRARPRSSRSAAAWSSSRWPPSPSRSMEWSSPSRWLEWSARSGGRAPPAAQGSPPAPACCPPRRTAGSRRGSATSGSRGCTRRWTRRGRRRWRPRRHGRLPIRASCRPVRTLG